MTDSTRDPEGRVRPFADFLGETNRGRTHRELSDGLRDLVLKVGETGKAGTITLTVRVELTEWERQRQRDDTTEAILLAALIACMAVVMGVVLATSLP